MKFEFEIGQVVTWIVDGQTTRVLARQMRPMADGEKGWYLVCRPNPSWWVPEGCFVYCSDIREIVELLGDEVL